MGPNGFLTRNHPEKVMKSPTKAQLRPVSLDDIFPITIVRPRSFKNGLRLVWLQFISVPIFLVPPNASKMVDPDLIPDILRKHPTIRRALVVKVVLEKMLDGTYYVSPAQQSNVSASSLKASAATWTK